MKMYSILSRPSVKDLVEKEVLPEDSLRYSYR
jgi:hypothetical protein